MIFMETSEPSQFHVIIGGAFGKQNLCPNCAKNLTLVATLPADLSSLLLSESIRHPIHLFCCWRCNLMLDYFVVSFRTTDYEILKFNPGTEEGVFHSEPYPDHFPELVINVRSPNPAEYKLIAQLSKLFTLDSIDYQIERGDFEKSEDLSLSIAEFFPHPYGEEFSSCPQCSNPKPLIACIPGTIGTVDFTGNRYVFMIFIICRECRKVSSTQIVD